MRIVEFVGVVVAMIAFAGWLLGERHTLASSRQDRLDAAERGERAPGDEGDAQ